ncbi:MAG: hypothetical protein IKQ50_06600 [Paludibacteraceae bacterium]|nr:hypothetical protein [Paludibacteraceae bacterium]MBR6168082.1 hypothetical protein [Paludibacteraceae bacterium]
MRKVVIMMIVGVALMALPATAQTFGTQQLEQPNAVFQSTSSMQGSGSAYSATPTLNSDGTASYNGAAPAPAKAPGGPHKSTPTNPKPGDQQLPLGDAVLPLMLMALAFGAVVAVRRRKAA